MKREMNKLVRDRIPEIIRNGGSDPAFRILSDEEYRRALDEKLKEEAAEFIQAHSAEEMADLLEVVYALMAANGLSPQDIERIRREKALARGAFERRIFLESVTD